LITIFVDEERVGRIAKILGLGGKSSLTLVGYIYLIMATFKLRSGTEYLEYTSCLLPEISVLMSKILLYSTLWNHTFTGVNRITFAFFIFNFHFLLIPSVKDEPQNSYFCN